MLFANTLGSPPNVTVFMQHTISLGRGEEIVGLNQGFWGLRLFHKLQLNAKAFYTVNSINFISLFLLESAEYSFFYSNENINMKK